MESLMNQVEVEREAVRIGYETRHGLYRTILEKVQVASGKPGNVSFGVYSG